MDTVRSYLRIAGYVATVALHGVVLTSLLVTAKVSTDERILVFQSNRPRYLTGWNVFLQCVHAILGLRCEYLLIKNAKNKQYSLPRLLSVTREKLFTNIVFPGSLLVATVFWILFTYDRELVFPQFLDQIIPLHYNHIIHTAVVPLVLYEVLVHPRYAPKSHAWNCAHIGLHSLAYTSVIFYTYYEKGQWLYPILEHLSPPLFVVFTAWIVGLAYLFYFLQWRLARLVWGAAPAEKRRGGKKIR